MVTNEIESHMDNRHVDTALATSAKIRAMKLQRLPHPRYSPDSRLGDVGVCGQGNNARQDAVEGDVTPRANIVIKVQECSPYTATKTPRNC
jgi:hypothetical protein